MDFESPYRTLSNQRWIVELAKDEYPSSLAYLGPVAIALVGHFDLEPRGFEEFLYDVHHQVYPRQTSEPTIAVSGGHRVDLRRMLHGGDYEPGLRLLSPAALRVFTGLAKMIDDIQSHPLSHQGLAKLRAMGPMTAVDMVAKLRTLSGGLVNPGSNQGTLGDTMNNVSYPFGAGMGIQ